MQVLLEFDCLFNINQKNIKQDEIHTSSFSTIQSSIVMLYFYNLEYLFSSPIINLQVLIKFYSLLF